jgi:ABC-type sugar transport system ATPase subunit
MKKIIYLISTFILLNFINGCAGYKPLYTTNLQFEITDYSLKTNKKLGKKIYSKLYNLSESSKKKNNQNIKKITITIDTKKIKSSTAKDSTGKILEYKIAILGNIQIKDYLTKDKIVNYNISQSVSYQVQDQYSETIKLENKNIENLVNKIYQNLLIKMSEIMSAT